MTLVFNNYHKNSFTSILYKEESHIRQELYNMILIGDMTGVVNIISEHPELLNSSIYYDWAEGEFTPLTITILKNRPEIAMFLLDSKCSIPKDIHKRIPIWIPLALFCRLIKCGMNTTGLLLQFAKYGKEEYVVCLLNHWRANGSKGEIWESIYVVKRYVPIQEGVLKILLDSKNLSNESQREIHYKMKYQEL
jgi:hypothetical protein